LKGEEDNTKRTKSRVDWAHCKTLPRKREIFCRVSQIKEYAS